MRRESSNDFGGLVACSEGDISGTENLTSSLRYRGAKSKDLAGLSSISEEKIMLLGKIGSWIHKKVVDPLIQILRRGAEPGQLAFSTALGFTLGVFPICGVTVFLCGIAIALLGSLCHSPSMMLANFIATPIELSLIVPFLRLGEFIAGGPHFPLTTDALKRVLTGHASNQVLQSIVNALLGWLVAAPFILGGLYILLLPCFKVLVRKFSSNPLSPRSPVSPSEIKIKVRDV
ncbi:unnamed protein product [Rhodiola kirilowii]